MLATLPFGNRSDRTIECNGRLSRDKTAGYALGIFPIPTTVLQVEGHSVVATLGPGGNSLVMRTDIFWQLSKPSLLRLVAGSWEILSKRPKHQEK
jgi:hypothetical protein